MDLAGSERIEKTGSTGGLIKEATHINKSLSFLEQVVLSLTKKAQASNTTANSTITKKDIIPAYRQSKLTYILKVSSSLNYLFIILFLFLIIYLFIYYFLLRIHLVEIVTRKLINYITNQSIHLFSH